MSSPIHHLDDDTEPTLGYAPPSARERILPVAEPPPRPRARTPAAVEMSSGNSAGTGQCWRCNASLPMILA